MPTQGSTAAKLAPAIVNMVVGDTRTLQALNSAGQPVTGLSWTSSNTAVVSLSSDNPPVLTALAVGHVTISAGGATADVTVSAGPLTPGTVLWSIPNSGSSVNSIVPAVPSATGVADVFSFQSDGTIQAITSDGAVAWTANVGQTCQESPDFQGGLVLLQCNGNIVKLDGITGQAYPAFTGGGGYGVAVHTDGTVFTTTRNLNPPYTGSVIGIDPTTGGQKFSVPIPNRDARGAENSARFSAAQKLVDLQRLEQQIVVDVDNASGQIVTARQRIASTAEASTLAKESLDAGEERLRAGTGTTFEVLELQKRLVEAEFAQLRARADYNEAVNTYHSKTGVTLRRYRVTVGR